MKDVIITPEYSKLAREKLNISQAKAAQGAGLNRAYLSQFESGARILDDGQLQALLDYYSQQGWQAPEESPVEYEVALSSGTFKACDGFLLPAEVEKDDIEALLGKYHENSTKIAEEQAKRAPRGFFGGLDEETSLEESQYMLELMATNYLIIKRLHGQQSFDAVPTDSENIKTLGDFVLSKLYVGLAGQSGIPQATQ